MRQREKKNVQPCSSTFFSSSNGNITFKSYNFDHFFLPERPWLDALSRVGDLQMKPPFVSTHSSFCLHGDDEQAIKNKSYSFL